MSYPAFTQDERLAIELFCAGDETFFITYRRACSQQFLADIDQANQSLAAMDLMAFKRTLHSMKGVLKSLGQPLLAREAAWLDEWVTLDDDSQWMPIWKKLCSDIQAMCVETPSQVEME